MEAEKEDAFNKRQEKSALHLEKLLESSTPVFFNLFNI
jgi:hypothetical protein